MVSTDIIRVNMKTRKSSRSTLEEKDIYLGGRLLTSRIVAQEVPPTCHPLGKHNKLVFACGPLAGTLVTSANRLSAGAKSPLTGGIKESNAGGMVAYHMGKLNIRGIIIEDIPEDSCSILVLHVSLQGTSLISMPELKELTVSKKAEILYNRFGSHVALTLIGPVGERRLPAAGIANSDKDGVVTRYCGRGGLGAVMGSKCLVGIVYDSTGTPKTSYVDRDKLNVLHRTLAQRITQIPQTAEVWRYCGTPAMMSKTNKIGALPTRNFSTGTFKGVDDINALAMYDKIVLRGGVGTPTHGCMSGCLLQCSNVYPSPDGKKILCSPMEYENMGLLGSNLCINDLDAIARLNTQCNEYGTDAIETGAALGVAMDAGVLAFGDAKAAEAALEEMGQGTPFGRIIGSGAGVTGIAYGWTRVPIAKNQAMPAYDPRSIKGAGVTYATSPQGADHTAGSTVRAKVVHNEKEGQVEASAKAQIGGAMFADMLGVCMKLGTAIPDWTEILEMINARYGVAISLETLKAYARETIALEKQFNENAGMGAGCDTLPEFFYEEENPASQSVFDISAQEMQEVFTLIT